MLVFQKKVVLINLLFEVTKITLVNFYITWSKTSIEVDSL